MARRRLDNEEHHIVKVFYSRQELVDRLSGTSDRNRPPSSNPSR
jgi:hypothetical protein